MTISKKVPVSEKIILVDPQDQKIGEIEKLLAHQYGMLHRAFSIFIFRQTNEKLELLLQQRSEEKYHGGGLWTNTCCSHPHPNETIKDSAEKRLKGEMGIYISLKEVGKFHYVATFDNGLTENEIDHVFIGFYGNEKICINKNEVKSYAWVEVSYLQQQLMEHPEKYTVWFKQALEIALNSLDLIMQHKDTKARRHKAR